MANQHKTRLIYMTPLRRTFLLPAPSHRPTFSPPLRLLPSPLPPTCPLPSPPSAAAVRSFYNIEGLYALSEKILELISSLRSYVRKAYKTFEKRIHKML